ncbi:hypothetical protein BC834DRAFT_446691 [Gloeopeniophorella convolvens]|nr:hypothetical protein BC834DRAFT_446691 [Gloeopeniophorella convolvens]
MYTIHTRNSRAAYDADHHRHRHFPRGGPKHGLSHTTIIIVAVVASVGGVLFTLFLWRILSRHSSRSGRVPLPPRQALVHQREHQLSAFAEHKNNSVPQNLFDPHSPAPARHDSNASLLPHIRDSTNTSRHASTYTHETDEGTDDPSLLHSVPLHPPVPSFSMSNRPPSSSSASLQSSNEHSSPPSEATTPASPFSTSSTQPMMRTNSRPKVRPFSMGSVSTTQTGATARSRASIRGPPHAPHNNIQIVLPAPLAPELYSNAGGNDARIPRPPFLGDSAQRESWRGSLTDKWIAVGQGSEPVPKVAKRQSSRETMKSQSRRSSREASSTSLPQRSSSNPPPLSRLRQSSTPSLGHLPSDTPPHPPVPRISSFGTLPRQDIGAADSSVGREGPSSPLRRFLLLRVNHRRRNRSIVCCLQTVDSILY